MKFIQGSEVIKHIKEKSLREVKEGNLQPRTFVVKEKYGGYPWNPKFLYYEVED